MEIVLKIRLDQKQIPYWSARLEHKKDVVVEVQSKTFNPRNVPESKKLYVDTLETMWSTLRKDENFDTIMKMLIQD
jgi:hypothetical protein